jgi:hypothetical protein
MRAGDYSHSGILLPLEAFDDGGVPFNTRVPKNNTEIEDRFDETLVRETQGFFDPPILTLNGFHEIYTRRAQNHPVISIGCPTKQRAEDET